MKITQSLITTWLSETGQLDDDFKPGWRDLNDEQRIKFLEWIEQHHPEQEEAG